MVDQANDNTDVGRARARSRQAWTNRSGWDALYNDAYRYVLPNRRPGGKATSKQIALEIFDMTAPNSAMHFAGELQRQVFPAATPFQIETGPLIAARLPAAQKRVLDRKLQELAAFVYPFFKTGDFDTAVHEMCTDLAIGTGALLPMRGPSLEEPLIFVSIPQDEIAIGTDAWGRVNFVSWKRQNLCREAVVEAWPKGNFTEEYRQQAKAKPYDEVTIYQDFRKLPTGGWEFLVYPDRDGPIISTQFYRTQPIAVPRFYRVPGENYGRGPILFALPTIKTVNKAQELALKAAAIQMLGIWGYRAGGTFNPDTVRVGPGEMWPMQSTGGVLGPDVQRLDPASGRLDAARLIIGGQQQQIREAMLDTRLPDDGGTPASASEIAARMRQNAGVHIGAYGRLNRETIAVIVPRAMEILNEWRILPQLMSFNELLVTMSIASPMAAALKQDELSGLINYFQLVGAVAPDRVGEFVKTEAIIDRARVAMLVSSDVVPSPDEAKAWSDQQAAKAVAATGQEALVKAAPQLAAGMMAEAA